MEFRGTFPLGIGAFDIFHPSVFLSLIAPHVPGEGYSTTSKTKTDEYIVLPGNGQLNVKFGDGGKTYDVKFRRNEDLTNEDWLSVAKGSLPDNPGDALGFSRALRVKRETETNPEVASALELVAGYLEDPTAGKRVFTRKNLTTLKAPTPSGKVFVAEQIDFSIWYNGSPDGQPRKVFRSISLEGDIPPGVQEAVHEKLKSIYGEALIMGGFPYMVEVAILSPPHANQFFELV